MTAVSDNPGVTDSAAPPPATFADEHAFNEAVEKHRRELHVHCYRMVGNFEEAEDLVQETLLRAWRARDSFERGVAEGKSGNVRAWLYRIATNACLDTLRGSSSRRLVSFDSYAEVPWLQPYPDRLLDELATDNEPEAAAVARETIELAYVAMIQLLPARQRAVLILRDVVGWSAKQTADALETHRAGGEQRPAAGSGNLGRPCAGARRGRCRGVGARPRRSNGCSRASSTPTSAVTSRRRSP